MEGTRIAEILSEHRECYASCNRSHPHCANYIHGSQDVWPCETFELATLAAQAERYRTALAQRDAQWAAMPRGWRSIIRDRVARLEAGEEVVAAAALEGDEK